jgi:hypothetical protein
VVRTNRPAPAFARKPHPVAETDAISRATGRPVPAE